MKKGYKKILIFELFLIVIFLLNSFIENILSKYILVVFLTGIIFIFKFIFGIEKEKKRYLKDVLIEIFIFYLIGFMLFYLLGLITGFYKNLNYLTIYGIKDVILPLVLFIIIKEYLRNIILVKTEGSKLLNVVTCVLFILIDLTSIITIGIFSTKKGIFDFIAMYLLPAISTNIVANMIVKKTSYKVNCVWILVIKTYAYILPIIPNVGDYILSIIRLLVPILIYMRAKNFFDKVSDEYISRDYNKRKIGWLLISSIISLIIIYFTSGHFSYQTIAIASGSMETAVYKGDVVIVKKIEKNYSNLKKGDIISYVHNGNIIVHRIEKIFIDNNIYYFYTKGDANDKGDNYVVYQEDVIGVVKGVIPYIGIPTVWLSEI